MFTIQLQIEGCVDCPYYEYVESIGYTGTLCGVKKGALLHPYNDIPKWCPILVKEDKGENSD